jgi:hypothetical protein
MTGKTVMAELRLHLHEQLNLWIWLGFRAMAQTLAVYHSGFMVLGKGKYEIVADGKFLQMLM